MSFYLSTGNGRAVNIPRPSVGSILNFDPSEYDVYTNDSDNVLCPRRHIATYASLQLASSSPDGPASPISASTLPPPSPPSDSHASNSLSAMHT